MPIISCAYSIPKPLDSLDLNCWKGIACDWSDVTLSEYTGINCFLSSDEDNCIVKGDVTKNPQAMIKKMEDVEGPRLRNTKELLLF